MLALKFNISKLNNESYKKFVDNLDFCGIRCTCGCCSLVKFGKYHRSVTINGECISLDIQRVYCKVCHKTHAVLSTDIIPYMTLSMSDAMEIIETCTKADSADYEAKDILNRFRIWKEKLNIIGALLKDDISHIIQKCSSLFHMCFLQHTRRKYCNNTELYEVEYCYLALST